MLKNVYSVFIKAPLILKFKLLILKILMSRNKHSLAETHQDLIKEKKQKDSAGMNQMNRLAELKMH